MDFVGGKKILVVACIGMTISCMALPLGTSLWWMAIAWSLVRVFGAATWPAIVKIVSKWFSSKHMGMVTSLLSLSFLFGDSVAVLYLGALIAFGVGWQGLFFIAGVSLFVCCVIVLLILRGSPEAIGQCEADAYAYNRLGPSGNESKPNSWQEVFIPIFTSSAFWILALYYSGLYLMREIFFTWIVAYIVSKFNVDIDIGGIALLLYNIFGAISVLEAGVLTDKLSSFKRDLIMSCECFLLALSLALLCYIDTTDHSNIYTSITIISLCGFFLLGPFSLPAGVLSIKFGGKKSCATMSGMLDCVGTLISLLSGPLGEMASSKNEWPKLWGILSLTAFICCILGFIYAFLDRREIKLLTNNERKTLVQPLND